MQGVSTLQDAKRRRVGLCAQSTNLLADLQPLNILESHARTPGSIFTAPHTFVAGTIQRKNDLSESSTLPLGREHLEAASRRGPPLCSSCDLREHSSKLPQIRALPARPTRTTVPSPAMCRFEDEELLGLPVQLGVRRRRG